MLVCDLKTGTLCTEKQVTDDDLIFITKENIVFMGLRLPNKLHQQKFKLRFAGSSWFFWFGKRYNASNLLF
jgi:hypothetical protein